MNRKDYDEAADWRALKCEPWSAAEKDAARARLLDFHTPLVKWVVKRLLARQPRFKFLSEDLVAEGYAGLLHAVDLFDPAKGFRFSTYAQWAAKHACERFAWRNATPFQLPAHATQVPRWVAGGDELEGYQAHMVDVASRHPYYGIPGGIADPRQPFPGKGLHGDSAAAVDKVRLAVALRKLSPKYRKIIDMRFGLGGDPPATLGAIGKAVGVTRERVRQLESKALRAMSETMSRAV